MSLCRWCAQTKNPVGREIVVPKIQATKWVLRTLPNHWSPQIRATLRFFHKMGLKVEIDDVDLRGYSDRPWGDYGGAGGHGTTARYARFFHCVDWSPVVR
jgi:hypothetical protein